MITLCNLDKIRAFDINKGIAMLMEKFLPLTDHTEEIIIKDNDLHSWLELHDRSQFLDRHLNATIPDHCNNWSVWSSIISANRCRQCITHCTQPTAGDIAFTVIIFCVAAGDHLVLTHIGNNYCFTFC